MNHTIKTIGLSLLVILCTTLQAQEEQKIWHWMQQLGGPGWDMPNGIAIDSKDNVYIAGGFTEALQGSKKAIKSEGNRDVYVARFNSKGKLQWLWQAGGEKLDKISAIKTAPDNDLYVTGLLEGEIKFGKQKLEGEGKKLFVARINKRGKSDWVQTFPYSGSASAYLLETNNIGQLIVGGMFTDTLICEGKELLSKGHNDMFVARISREGLVEEIKTIGSKGKEKLTALSTDSLGHIYLSGNYSRELVNNGISMKPMDKKSSNSFLMQMDSTLTTTWVKPFYSPSYAEITGLACDKLNQVLLSGNFNHTLQVDTLQYETQGLTDFFVARTDSMGNIQWLKSFGGKYSDLSNSLELNKLGGAMVSGSFNDSLKMDSLVVKTKHFRSDAFIAQLDTAGMVTWAGTLQGDSRNSASGVALDSKGNLYLVGSFNGSLSAGNEEIESMGGEDIFVAKYYNCPPVLNAIQAPDVLCQGAETLLYVDKNYSHVVWNDTLRDVNEMTICSPGSYHVAMVDKRGCVITDSIEIAEVPAFEFSLGKDTAILVDAQLELLGPDNFYEYEWQDGSNLQNLLVYNNEGRIGHKKYELTVTDSLGCAWNSEVSIEFYKTPENADLSQGEKLITIYPNPVKEDFYWTFETRQEAQMTVEIADVAGHVKHHENIARYIPMQKMHIPVSHLSAGAYYFSIISNGKRISKKFIKN